MGLAEALRSGDVRALARAISVVEERREAAGTLLRQVFPHAGTATIVGVTGAPGAGKSSLIDRLVAWYRAAHRRVGVVAVDPSSAFTGGSILGDRVRMLGHASDGEVFIRSMATRGHLGGLSPATADALDLIDAAGYDPVIVETVGVGQDEVEIVRTADVVVVVLVPGMGDDIQALKAGLLEIADLFVLNKADRPGVERLQADLESMLELGAPGARPRPALLRTVAVRGEGVEALRDAIDDFMRASGREAQRRARRRERAQARLRAVLGDRLQERVLRQAFPGDRWAQVVQRIADREEDPYTVAEDVLGRLELR